MKEPAFPPDPSSEYVDSTFEGQGHAVIEHAGRQRLSHVLILVAPSASSNTEFQSEDTPGQRV